MWDAVMLSPNLYEEHFLSQSITAKESLALLVTDLLFGTRKAKEMKCITSLYPTAKL